MAEDSVAAEIVHDILEEVKVQIELEAAQSLRRTSKRKLDEAHEPCKRRRLTLLEASDSDTINCRICYDSNTQLSIIYPCKCKGSIGAIHLNCLEHWLEESNRNTCELCGYRFAVERTPRYKALRSVSVWLCLRQDEHQIHARNPRGDLLRCLIVTPIAVACSYICIVAADFYAANNYENFPPVRWTSYSLLAVMQLFIFSYFVWMYMAIQYHQKAWFHWWQKTSKVKVILPADSVVNHNTEKSINTLDQRRAATGED